MRQTPNTGRYAPNTEHTSQIAQFKKGEKE
jgi:hypothetical protein